MHDELVRTAARVREALSGGAPYAPQPRLTDDPPPDGTALVVRTSGSTGTPREVALPAAALRASAAATHERLGGPGRWFLALPPTHVAGLQVISRAVLAGTAVGGGEPGPFTPGGFAAAAGRFLSGTDGLPTAGPVLPDDGVTTGADHRAAGAPASAGGPAAGGPVDGGPAGERRAYVSLVPTQAHRLVEAADAGAPAGLDTLARFDGVLLGGAAAPPALLTRLRDAGVRAVTTYGMSETCGGCVYDGVPLPGVRMRLDGAGGDGSGVVELSGPVLASGYPGDDDATAAAFRTDADGTRWFRTSDLGRLDGEAPGSGGRLRILGRADDVIVTGGVNVAPAAVEAALAELGEVCVVGVPDDEWGQAVVAVLVSADAAGPDESRLVAAPRELTARVRDLVATALGRAAAPRHVYLTDALPLRGPGKPDRRRLAAAVRA